ncbi:MAG: polysaccharide deacetylase family protein [Ginsengibacter sp.]
MSLLKSIYYKCASTLPLALLNRLSSPGCLFPYHHIVSDEEVLHIKYLYPYKNVRQFENDLEVLLKNFKPISPGDLIKYINHHNSIPRNSFLLSFDDGFREVYDVIAPILEAKGVPAIFFINPAFIDNRKLFYRSKSSLLIHEVLNEENKNETLKKFRKLLNAENSTADDVVAIVKKLNSNDELLMDNLAKEISLSFDNYLKNKRPFLTTEQLISLNSRGFTIGSHSWSHPYYDKISLEKQIDETLKSCEFVKDNIFQKNMTFSFPYSDVALSQSLFDELKKTNIDLMFGIQNQKEELHNRMVHRFNAERPLVKFDDQLKGLLILMLVQKMLGNQKIKRA